MGLFGKKSSLGSFGNYKYEIKYKKCVGYINGEIEYFWAVKKVTELEAKGKSSNFYRADIPSMHQGLPVRVILKGALRHAPPVSISSSHNLIAIDCDQGDPYGGPFVGFGANDHVWEGAIFTYDENDPMFAPLAFHPSDITYGMIAIYWTEGVSRSAINIDYGSWLDEQIRGNGKEVKRQRKHLFSFNAFKGEKPDWSTQQRFLVKESDKIHPFAFKCTDEMSTEAYSTY